MTAPAAAAASAVLTAPRLRFLPCTHPNPYIRSVDIHVVPSAETDASSGPSQTGINARAMAPMAPKSMQG